jgi:hypothetical protein
MDAPPPVALIIGAIILVAIFVAVFMYIQGGQASGPAGPAGPDRNRAQADAANDALDASGDVFLQEVLKKYW